MADARRGRAMIQRLPKLSKTDETTRERKCSDLEVQSNNDDSDRMACDGLIEACLQSRKSLNALNEDLFLCVLVPLDCRMKEALNGANDAPDRPCDRFASDFPHTAINVSSLTKHCRICLASSLICMLDVM